MASTDKIGVIEIFGPTIMGEGIYVGTPTMFVRTASCDYNGVCLNCDSMHAVDPEQYKNRVRVMTAQEIVDELLVRSPSCSWITLSGGNPAVWDFTEVIRLLQDAGKHICLETQGSKWNDWIPECDLIYVAPKGPGMVTDVEASFRNVTAFMARLRGAQSLTWNDRRTYAPEPEIVIKIPIFVEADLDFAERITEFYPGYQMCLSVGNQNPPVEGFDVSIACLRTDILESYERIIESVLRRPRLMRVTVLPQIHVLVWGNKQGV